MLTAVSSLMSGSEPDRFLRFRTQSRTAKTPALSPESTPEICGSSRHSRAWATIPATCNGQSASALQNTGPPITWSMGRLQVCQTSPQVPTRTGTALWLRSLS